MTTRRRPGADLSRRDMLAALGGAAMFLPLLETRAHAATRFPQRLIIVQTTNGVLHDKFWPSVVDEKAFTLDSPILAPLQPYRDDIVLIGGLEMTVAINETVPLAGGIGHHNLPHLLTGTFGAAGRIRDGRTDPIGNSISLDQHIAKHLAETQPTPFRSLELGALTAGLTNGRGDNDGYISFNGPAIGTSPARPDGNSPEENPYRVFDKLFTAGGGALGPEALAKVRAERKSVIDFVGRDIRRLKRSLGTDAQRKLTAHLDGVRRLESEINAAVARPADAPMCKPPVEQLDPPIALKLASSLPTIVKTQFDLLTAAMACDLTRVATVMMCNPSNENLTMPWLGIDGAPTLPGYKVRDHHNVTHNAGVEGADKVRAEAWFISQLAALIGALKAVPEGNGTMLDNTLVWWANNMDDGGRHTCRGMPWILAGRFGGALRTGRYVRYGDWGSLTPYTGKTFLPHNHLLASIAQAMGAPVGAGFGDPGLPGTLPGLFD